MPDYGPKTYNCLSGCGEKFKVDPVWDRAPMEVVAESMAPVIKATVISTNQYITVGNESYPSNENKAVIKSLDMGFMNSKEGTLEIVDEDGGALSMFLESTVKCTLQLQQAAAKLVVQVGWVYTTCEGQSGMILSPEVRSNLLSLDTSLNGGLIRFVMKFGTADNVAKIFRENKTFGEQNGKKRMKLEDAIAELMRLCPEMNVDFGYYDQKGELKRGRNKLQWLNNGSVVLGGPESFWQSDRQDRFATIAKWVEPYRIKDGEKDRGVVLINDPSVPNTLLVLKDPNPEFTNIENDNNGVFGGRKHLGTFVVNGGKCSNVLEFNPTFNFVSAMSKFSSGGNTKGGLSSDSELKETTKTPSEKKNCDTSGIQQTITLTQQIEDTAGKDAPTETNKSQQAHIRANGIFDIQGKILEAELRIVGSTFPDFYRLDQIGAPLSIVVINPFTIRGGKAGESCGDFLKKADCNPYFSNRKWLLNGVSHSVKEGSFVTILKVYLAAAPGEIEYGVPLGGDPMGGTLPGC